MNRFASTRSEKRASQPLPGRAQCSVGSIDDDGIRYGLTTHALIASTIAIAPTIVTIQSIVIRQPRGRLRVACEIGFSAWWRPSIDFARRARGCRRATWPTPREAS